MPEPEQPTLIEVAESMLSAAASVRDAMHLPGARGVTDSNGNPVVDIPGYAEHLNGQGIGYALVSIATSLEALLEVMANPAVIREDDPMEAMADGPPIEHWRSDPNRPGGVRVQYPGGPPA